MKHILKAVPLSRYSPLKIGGVIEELHLIDSLTSLQETMSAIWRNNQSYLVFGAATKILFSDEYTSKWALKIIANNITFHETEVVVEAGVKLPFFARLMCERGYRGFASLTMIPGDIGGAIVTNAGAFTEAISDYLIAITLVDPRGEIQTYRRDELAFSYRHSLFKEQHLGVIYQATFRLEKAKVEDLEKQRRKCERKRLESQPHGIRTLGSTFVNPPNHYAGELIESLGLKGLMVGHVKINEKHANFLEITEGATAKEVIEIIDMIRIKVYNKYDILLMEEIIRGD